MLTIIEYGHEHLNACAGLYHKTFAAEPFNFAWLTEDAVRRYFADAARHPRFLGYIPLTDGVPAGACLGCVDDYAGGAVYEIREFFVERGSQGRGLGAEFLAAIEKDLTNRDISCITLLTRNDIPAYGFYLKNGYAENAGAVLLAKNLASSF